MAKNTKAKEKHLDRKTRKHAEQVVDTFARVLQIVAIIAVVAVYITDGAFETVSVPIYVPAGLLGIAIGLNPEQISRIITSAVKAALGKK